MTTARDLRRILDEHATEQLDVGSTRAAPPPQVWDARAERIARRSIDGVDHDPEPLPRSRKALMAAFAANRDNGVPMRSSSDPDRFGKGAMGGGASAPRMSSAKDHEREMMALLQREIERVADSMPPFLTMNETEIDGRLQAKLWEWQWCGRQIDRVVRPGRKPSASSKSMQAPSQKCTTIKDRAPVDESDAVRELREMGHQVTERNVHGIVVRFGRRIWPLLEAKGWVRATARPQAAPRAKAEWDPGARLREKAGA